MELLIIAGGGGVVTEPRTYGRKEKNEGKKSSLQLMLVSVFMSRNSKNKITYSASEALLCFTQKNNFCVMNKIKLV